MADRMTKRPKCPECDSQLPSHRGFCSKNRANEGKPPRKQPKPDPRKQNFKKRPNDGRTP